MNYLVPPPVHKVKKIPLEKVSEKRLFTGIRSRGGECYKFSSPQRRGVSDRIVIIYGMIIFVEMKRQGVITLSKKQTDFKKECTKQCTHFCTVSGHDGVDEFLKFVDSKRGLIEYIRLAINALFPLFNDRVFK